MGNAFDQLFKKKELSKEAIIKKVRWCQALEACEEYHRELMLCKKSAIMSTCSKENKNFWDCVQAITNPEKVRQEDRKEPP